MTSDLVNVEAMRIKLYREALWGKSIGRVQRSSTNRGLRVSLVAILAAREDFLSSSPTGECPPEHSLHRFFKLVLFTSRHFSH
ncbi:hypothetical protein TNCV_1881251 [Trichonephila clavipes]|nr:hypothetical protein TNCV_1881251 [Trichonephila clavipes]